MLQTFTSLQGMSVPRHFAHHQELAGAKLRPSREQSTTFARWGVSDIENYSSDSHRAGM